jgi:hypothetical protein
MKINEVASAPTLQETIARNNDTGFLTEDLVKIVEQDQSGAWSRPMTAEELEAEMASWE